MDVIEFIAIIIGLAIGIIVGYFVRKNISETKIGEAKALANDIIDKANKDSETIKKEKLLMKYKSTKEGFFKKKKLLKENNKA